MKKVEKRRSNLDVCAICGRRIWFDSVWSVEISVPFQIEPLKWTFCTDCCHSKTYAEIISREFMAYHSISPSDG